MTTTQDTLDLLDAQGTIKLKPAAFYRSLPWEAFRLWCHYNARYLIVTAELVTWLRERIGDRRAIEIGSGCGDLGRHLGLHATDSKVQELNPLVRMHYDLIGQPRCKYPEWVEQADALEAVQRHQPQVVVGSWITHWVDPNGPVAPGSSYGVREDVLLEQVEEYIMVGNLHVHRDKPILSQAEVIELPGLVSRAQHGDLDRIFVWRGKKATAVIPEDEKDRRGEPVLIDGQPGTIEWGGVTKPASIYMEQGGRKVGVKAADIVADPGGDRPVWRRVTGG